MLFYVRPKRKVPTKRYSYPLGNVNSCRALCSDSFRLCAGGGPDTHTAPYFVAG